MIETLFGGLYDAMAGAAWLALLASFGWGVLSILLSPCHLSSIPLIIGYISSQGKIQSAGAFRISFYFSLGILITIAIVGLITASLGRLMGDLGGLGNMLVAGIFFLVGLYLLDIIKLNWSSINLKKAALGHGALGALLLGLLFGLAVGPCTFAYMAPVLGIVFQTAQDNMIMAAALLISFGIGHCAVIVGAGTLTGRVQKYLNWSEGSRALLWLRRCCGVLVILGGVYLVYLNY